MESSSSSILKITIPDLFGSLGRMLWNNRQESIITSKRKYETTEHPDNYPYRL